MYYVVAVRQKGNDEWQCVAVFNPGWGHISADTAIAISRRIPSGFKVEVGAWVEGHYNPLWRTVTHDESASV